MGGDLLGSGHRRDFRSFWRLRRNTAPRRSFPSEGTYRSDHLWARTRFFNLFGNPVT